MATSQGPSKRKSFSLYIKSIALLLCFILSFEQSGFAQIAEQLDISGSFTGPIDSFSRPAHLRYLAYNNLDQSFKVILNQGDFKQSKVPEPENSVIQPLKLFYIGLAIPNKNFWVNLRPDSRDQIIDDSLAKTDMGKILLEADLELKKDLARATFPSTPQGKEYWDMMYKKIEEVYGPNNNRVYLNTRIWVTPGEVVICEDKNSAYIYKAALNVSTEAAYLKDKQGTEIKDPRDKATNEYSAQLMQELILPEIRKEVNTGKKYASLRQVYYSLILAQWFKRKFYGAGGLYPYLIDRQNLNGLTSNHSWSKDTYFHEYRRSYIQKEYDLQVQTFNLFGRAVRTYANGGVDFTGILYGNGPAAKTNIISSESLVPPSLPQADLLEVNSRKCSLQEPYSEEFFLPEPTQNEEETSSKVKTSAVGEQSDSSREIENSSSTKNTLPASGIQKRSLGSSSFILKILSSQPVLKFTHGVNKILSSLPKPVIKLMFIIPVVGALLLCLQNTASAFSITADSANGHIKNLVFQFQPWQNSPDPANETLSGIGQVIGQAHGLHGQELIDFIYNQFIPQMNPLLADQGISNVNIIHVGDKISIPAKFLEGLTPDSIQGVVNSLHSGGWIPLDLNINVLPVYNPTDYIPSSNIPHQSDQNPPYSYHPHVTPPQPGNINTPQDSDNFFTQTADWINQHQSLAIIAGIAVGTLVLLLIGRAVYIKIHKAKQAKNQEGLDDIDALTQEILAKNDDLLKSIQAQSAQADQDDIADINKTLDDIGYEEIMPEDASLLKELEAVTDIVMDNKQIKTILNALMNSDPGKEDYERARAIARHIHPDEFNKLKEAAECSPYYANQHLITRLNLITLERPSELSVGLARARSKIHEWKIMLAKKELTPDDVDMIAGIKEPSKGEKGYAERIIGLMPFLLDQETNDRIGSINKIINQSYGLIKQTILKLLRQKNMPKELYDEKVKKLLIFGHYFADYLAALGYFADLDIAKKYQYDGHELNGDNGNGNGRDAGKKNKDQNQIRLRYNWWHRITAVPGIEKSAREKLKKVMPLLNTAGNKLTPEQYFAVLKPTRIGSSQSWWLRKPVSIFISLFLSMISLCLFFFAGPINLLSPLTLLKGFLIFVGLSSVPLTHYVFAKIGSRSQTKGLEKSHSQIETLQKAWMAFKIPAGNRYPGEHSPQQSNVNLPVPDNYNPKEAGSSIIPKERDHSKENHTLGEKEIKQSDIIAIAELADSLNIKPVDLPSTIEQALEEMFETDRTNKLKIVVMPEELMYTKNLKKIKGPVRLDNMIFVGDEHFADYLKDTGLFLINMLHEMGQRVSIYRPDLGAEARDLAKDTAAAKISSGENIAGETAVPATVYPAEQANDPGGIDLRAINFTIRNRQMTLSNPGTNPDIKNRIFDNDGVERELIEINRLIKAKIIPNDQRLNDCLQNIPESERVKYTREINNCLAEIFMLEEEYAEPSQASLVNLLQAVVK
jgi:CHASE3 domain sensor protein